MGEGSERLSGSSLRELSPKGKVVVQTGRDAKAWG